MSAVGPTEARLLTDVQALIEAARHRVGTVVHSEVTMLHWRVGRRIQVEVLGGERAAYGERVMHRLSAGLTASHGRGWSTKQLRHCLRAAETFSEEHKSGIHVAEYLTVLPPRDVLEARFHQAIETARRRRLSASEG